MQNTVFMKLTLLVFYDNFAMTGSLLLK